MGVRERRKQRTALAIPNSKLQKIALKSATQAQNVFLQLEAGADARAKEHEKQISQKAKREYLNTVKKLAAAGADRYAHTKLYRRLAQTTTGRLLDVYGIWQKGPRALIQKEVQEVINASVQGNQDAAVMRLIRVEEIVFMTTKSRTVGQNFKRELVEQFAAHKQLADNFIAEK